MHAQLQHRQRGRRPSILQQQCYSREEGKKLLCQRNADYLKVSRLWRKHSHSTGLQMIWLRFDSRRYVMHLDDRKFKLIQLNHRCTLISTFIFQPLFLSETLSYVAEFAHSHLRSCVNFLFQIYRILLGSIYLFTYLYIIVNLEIAGINSRKFPPSIGKITFRLIVNWNAVCIYFMFCTHTIFLCTLREFYKDPSDQKIKMCWGTIIVIKYDCQLTNYYLFLFFKVKYTQKFLESIKKQYTNTAY